MAKQFPSCDVITKDGSIKKPCSLMMKHRKYLPKAFFVIVTLLMLQAAMFVSSSTPSMHEPVRKILFIGDSMTGWLSERLNAYGEENGFEVSTIVWDGSTISKWAANRDKLQKIISEQNPDAVFVSLGMNELFETNPEHKLKSAVETIEATVGSRPLLWVGPPSWPGSNKGKILCDWLDNKLGDKHFFNSLNLELPRQSSKNPHPTKAGMIEWMDKVINWIPDNSEVILPGIRKPSANQMLRGKNFTYKRMKETL